MFSGSAKWHLLKRQSKYALSVFVPTLLPVSLAGWLTYMPPGRASYSTTAQLKNWTEITGHIKLSITFIVSFPAPRPILTLRRHHLLSTVSDMIPSQCTASRSAESKNLRHSDGAAYKIGLFTRNVAVEPGVSQPYTETGFLDDRPAS